MPAAAFNPLAALVVHSQVDLDPLTFELLEAEEALLIHGCARRATREEWRRYSKSGSLCAFVRHSPRLTYSVTATALYPDGENLGNFHPGRCLSDRALAFVNGGRVPYQFEEQLLGSVPGKLIYLDPEQTPGAGDATEVSFTVEHAFIDLDTTGYPSVVTITYEDLATQAARVITAAAMAALLADVFQAEEEVTGTLTATLYNGDPASGGTALASVSSADWTTLSEPGAADTTHDACPEIIFPGGSGPRSITHIRLSRGSLVAVDFPLAAALVVPAWTYVRVNAADLVAKLTWPWDTTGAATRPARFALRYLFGDDTTGITTSATMTVKCYDGDPDAGGVLLDSFDVDRDTATWLISGGNYVSNQTNLDGEDLAPPGGWTIEYVTVELSGVATQFIKKAGTIVVAEGFAVQIPTGALDLQLA